MLCEKKTIWFRSWSKICYKSVKLLNSIITWVFHINQTTVNWWFALEKGQTHIWSGGVCKNTNLEMFKMLLFFKFQIFPKILKVLLTSFYPRFYSAKNDLSQWFKAGQNWVLSTIKLHVTIAQIKIFLLLNTFARHVILILLNSLVSMPLK